MFWSRRRPKGLEFASCLDCNQGTRLADMVASLISRVFPDPPDEATRAEISKLCASVRDNIPGLLPEMHTDDSAQMMHHRRLGTAAQQGGFLQANGPLVHAHMQTFGFKLGFALYYEATRRVVPKGGAVAARWFSNEEHMRGAFPPSDYDFLLPPQTLRQGSFEVGDQFSYQWRLTDDAEVGVFVSYFRYSFAVVSFVARDKEKLVNVETKHPMLLCAPGEITKLLP
jgi:hypothetical protein